MTEYTAMVVDQLSLEMKQCSAKRKILATRLKSLCENLFINLRVLDNKMIKAFLRWLTSEKRWYNRHPLDDGWTHEHGDHV